MDAGIQGKAQRTRRTQLVAVQGQVGRGSCGEDPLGRPLVGTELSMLKEFTEGQGGPGRVKVAKQGAAVPGSTLHSQGTFSF